MERTDSFTTWMRVVISAALVVTLSTALTFAGPTPVAQAALDILPTTSFELDGNLPGDVPGTGFDWTDPYGIGTTPDGYPTTGLYYVNENSDLCASPQDDIGASGPQVKLGDGPIWRHTFAEANPAQTDLAAVWVGAEKVKAPNGASGTQIFDVLYLGYELCQTSNGAFNGAVYFDGGDGILPYDPADTPTGSTDDQLIVFDFDPNRDPTATLYNFNGNRWVLDQTAVVPGSFEADASSDRIVGEAAINLTTFAGGILPPDECKTITVAGQAATVAGGSLTSAVKDLVEVEPLQISNCGGLDVTKLSSPADVEDGTYFPYLVGQLDAQQGGLVHDGTLTVSGADPGRTTEPNAATNEIDAQIQVNETHEWRNVISQPDYTIAEGTAVPDSGWTLETIECTYFDIFSGQEEVAVIDPVQDPVETFLVPPSVYGDATLDPASCEIVNATSAVTVVKTGAGDPTTQFTFDATGQGSFPLTIADDGSTPDVDESRKVFTVTPTSEVTITETIPAASPAWTLESIDCRLDSDDSVVLSETDPQDGEVTVTAVEGDGVTCTFTNNQAGRIIVEKIGAPDGGSFDFEADIDGNVDDTPDFSLVIPSVTGAGAYDSGDIPAGTYTISELLADASAGDGPVINGSVSCTNETPVGPTTGDVVATVDLAAGEVVTCTFSNNQLGRIIVQKVTTNGDGTFDFDLPGDAGDGSITTVDGTGTSTLSVDVLPGTHDVTETIPAGWNLDSATCSDGSGTPAIGEDSGSITGIDVAAGEIVTCTFTNTRETAELTLAKDWSVDAEPGDSVTLTATGDDAETAGPANGSSTAPATDTDAVLVVYPGETVRLVEAYSVGNVANYGATLTCDNGAAGTLTYTGGALSGSFAVVDDDPQDVICTFVNSRDAANLTLQKVWIDGFEGDTDRGLGPDTAVIDVDGSENTSTVGEATPASITVPVLSGATVDLSETLDGNTGTYTTELNCTDAAGLDYTSGDLDGTYTMPAEAADVTCTFTNTRTSTGLTLTKTWTDAADGDSVDLAIVGEAGTGNGVNSGDGTTAVDATLTVYSGEVVDLSEAFNPGDADWYNTGLTCTAGDLTYTADELAAELEVTTTADPITCTFTNDRRTASVVVAKDIAPNTDSGLFDLSINGEVELPDAGDGDATGAVPVLVGDPVSIGEIAGTDTDLANYTSALACDNGVVPNPNTGTAGGFEVPDTLADGATITCTFTNTRKSAELTLTKDWVNGATGDAVSLTASGDSENSLDALGSSTAPDTDADAVLTVWAGEDVMLTEVYVPDNTGSYSADLSCTDANGLTYTDLALSGTYAVPSTPVDVTCTFVNTRTSAEVTLQKAWVDGANGDITELDIDAQLGQIPVDGNTSTSGGVVGTETDDTNVVTATVLSGETVSLGEVLGADNTGAYDSTLACGQDVVTAGTAGTFTMPKDPAPITCTFTNTRTRVDLVVDKAWVDAVAGDTTEITVTGDLGDRSDTSTATGADDTETDAAVVTATVLSGETIDVAEVLGADNEALYTSSLDCGAGVIGNTDGEVTVAKDATDDITCTFTNTAERGTITIVKQVVGGDGDTAFPFQGDWDGAGDFTLTPPTDGSAQQVFTDVLVPKDGQPYTITELDPGALYGTTVTCTGDDEGGVASGPNPAESGRVGTIGLDDGESITCLFTNTQNGIVIIEKVAEGAVSGALDQDFSFTESGLGSGTFVLNDNPNLDPLENTVTFDNVVPGGAYSVTEQPTAGWEFTSLVCDDGQSATPSTVDGATATINVDPAEVVRCTYTNTAVPADISVTKTVDGGLDEAQDWAFDFTLTPDADPLGSQTASGTGDGADTVTWSGLVPGRVYTVREVLPGTNSTTYENGVLSCSTGDQIDDQTVRFVAPLGGEGVEVTCSVTNTAQSDVSYDKDLTDDPVRNADGTWSLSYTLTVENAADAGAGTYDLSDTFLFGEGVSIVADSAAVTNTTPGTIATNAAFDGKTDPVIVTGEAIAAGATHTYVVTVDVTIAVGPDTDGDCVRDEDGGTGFLNEMTIAIDGGEPETTDACAGFALLTLVKDVDNTNGGNATVADFPLTAVGPVTLTGISGTPAVSSAVPAGTYTLSEDQLVEGYVPGSFVCEGGTGTVTLVVGDNATCTITNVAEPVDLEITKNDDGITAIAGGAPFDYTITVQNVGDRDADLGEPVTVVDELPLPLQWVSFPGNCVQAGQTLTCDIDPALMTAGGDPVVITATVRAPADAASGTYVNEVSVTTEDDPVCEPIGDCEPPPCEEAASNNNIDCEPTPVDREGAIQIVKTDNVAAGDSVLPGEQYNYTLRVTNTGVSTILPGLVVTDDLPAQLSLVSVSGGAGWTCNNADPIECTYAPSLAPGASAPNITLVVSVNADATGTEIDNTAVVQGAVDRECPEPSAAADLSEAFVPACNQVTDDDDETTPLTAQADLAIQKTASVATVGAGGQFNWVLDVENLGPATAIDVVVGDLVPDDVTVTGVTSSFFDCSRSGNDVTCTRPAMAVGASGTITIAVSVPANAEGGTVDNVGTVESSTPDPNLDNNSDDASVVVVAQIPPTSVVPTPTIPATGSNSTGPVVQTALVLLMLGALGLAAARRRRPDEVTPTV